MSEIWMVGDWGSGEVGKPVAAAVVLVVVIVVVVLVIRWVVVVVPVDVIEDEDDDDGGEYGTAAKLCTNLPVPPHTSLFPVVVAFAPVFKYVGQKINTSYFA